MSSTRLVQSGLRASSRAWGTKINPATRQTFSTGSIAMVNASDLALSKGENAHDMVQQATELVDDGKWRICNGGKGLERGFKFKTFKATWDFMNEVAAECKKAKHHPEWSNVYNKTHIRWTTHDPEGLSGKDTSMARFCDEAAKKFNELDIRSTDPDEFRLAQDGTIEAGDCCSPRKNAL